MQAPLPPSTYPFADQTLQVLVDARETNEAFARLVSVLVDCGVGAIQLRDKQADDRTQLERARILSDRCRNTATRSIINDRPDLALLANADAVHVGQEELPVRDVRRLVGARMLIGCSTHSLAQAREAVAAGADYLGVGPVFPSATKKFASYPGLDLIAEITEASLDVPWFAIGGIRRANLREVIAAGASRIAVHGGALDQPDIAAAVSELSAALRSAESTYASPISQPEP